MPDNGVVVACSSLAACSGWPLALCTCNTVNSNCPTQDIDPNTGNPISLQGIYQINELDYSGLSIAGYTTPGVGGGTYINTYVNASFSIAIPDGVGEFFWALGMLGSVDGSAPYPQCSAINCPDGGPYLVGQTPVDCGPCNELDTPYVDANLEVTFPSGTYYSNADGEGEFITNGGRPAGSKQLVDLLSGVTPPACSSGTYPYQGGPLVKVLPTFYPAAPPYYPTYTAQPSDFANFSINLRCGGDLAIEIGDWQKAGLPSGGYQGWSASTIDMYGCPFSIAAIGVGIYWAASGPSPIKRQQPNVCINT